MRGRASTSDTANGKIILQSAREMRADRGSSVTGNAGRAEGPVPDSAPDELWVQFAEKTDFQAAQGMLLELLGSAHGVSPVHIYLRKEKAMKILPDEYREALEDGESADRVICDYISGMTDQYCVNRFEDIFIPKSWDVL